MKLLAKSLAKLLGIASCAVLLCLLGTLSFADDSYRAQMKGLDEQVQEIKSDVLGIAAELNRLEEKLLYPSNTQIAVFVAIRVTCCGSCGPDSHRWSTRCALHL